MDAGGTTIEVDRTPTPEEEFETFDPEEARARKLRNDSDQHLFAMAIMWENYLSLGADETQALMKLLPEDKAQILKLVPRAD